MVNIVESATLQLEIDPANSSWSLSSRQAGDGRLYGARLGVGYRLGGQRHQALQSWRAVEISTVQEVSETHGMARQVSIDFSTDQNGLQVALTFCLPESYPLLLWQLRVENRGRDPLLLDRLDMLRYGGLRFNIPAPELAFYSNGWQTLSTSGAYAAAERQRRTRLGFLQRPANVNPATPHTRRAGHFSSDLFAVTGDRASRRAVLAGFLSERQHFGSIAANLSSGTPTLDVWGSGDGLRLDPGASFESDWACLYFIDVDTADPLGTYLDAVAREHHLAPYPAAAEGNGSTQASLRRRIPTGWCSWYYYFEKLSTQDIRDNIAAAVSLQPDVPLELIQIDDGFESQWGDWLTFKPAFAQGVAPLASEISQAGFVPGLWLAPFIVHPGSRLAAEHPDWLLRGQRNRLVNAGYFANTLTTALDLTHPDAQAYASEVIHTAVQQWGFPYLKLDFLYAAALPGRHHDPTRTRAQVLRNALEALRRAAGEETMLLGCGCPLGPAIGIVDAMRIGPDVGSEVRTGWIPRHKVLSFILKHEPHVPSVRNTIQNSLSRAMLHRRWWINDPDCLLLRPDSELTLAEVQTLASVIALSGGSLLLSDYLPALPAERLSIAASLLPLIGKTPRVIDWLDAQTPRRLRLDLQSACGAWHLLALFNWEDKPQATTLRLAEYGLTGEGVYWGREFWSGKLYSSQEGSFHLQPIPAHGVTLLAVRRQPLNGPLYLGSTLHISQGQEVSGWQAKAGSVSLTIQRPGHMSGQADLYLPEKPVQAVQDGVPLSWTLAAPDVYRLPVKGLQSAVIDLTWGEPA